MIASGVAAGAISICQIEKVAPGSPASATVGTSGITVLRCALDTARMRARSARTAAKPAMPESNSMSSDPAARSSCAWPEPR